MHDRVVRVALVTARAVGLRFAEGLLASEERLRGQLLLDVVLGPTTFSELRNVSHPAEIESWARCFRVPFKLVDSPGQMHSALRQTAASAVVFAGWPHYIDLDASALRTRLALGVHPRRLPEGRGRSPISWSVELDEREAGLCAFLLNDELDAGDVVLQLSWPRSADADATSLHLEVSQAHFELGRLFAASLPHGFRRQPQDASNAGKWPHREGSYLHLSPTMTCGQVRRRVLAQSPPYPPATVSWGKETRTVDSHKTQLAWSGRRSGAENFEFADGSVMLVLYG